MKNYWTKQKVDKLTKFWEQGVSSREIAAKLGGVSRNAVIGKANRLGLSKKIVTTSMKTDDLNLDVTSLVPNMSGCKWPIGHPGDKDFYFCSKEVIPSKPYCNEHCLTAYRRKDNSQKIKKFFKINSEN